MDSSDETVEVYRTSSELEVNRVVDQLLNPAGIECFVHDRVSHALPARGEAGSYHLAVPRQQAGPALDVLRSARQDGELDISTGEIVEP